MANGGRLRGGLGGIPGLGGYLGGRQLNRERQTHNMNMQNQRQLMKQRQQQIEALKREAEQYEENEELRGLQRQLQTAQVREDIEDQPEVARQEDLQRELETRETRYTLDNWEDLKAREQQQALLDMEQQRAETQGTRADTAEAYASAGQQRVDARQGAVDLIADSIPEDPSSMSQRGLSRLRSRASAMGYDPDDLGIPGRAGTPQSQQQLRELRRRSTAAREQRNAVELAWEKERADLWRQQQEHERNLSTGDYSPTQLTRLMEERNRKQDQLTQARENGNTELASQLDSDLEHYNNRITRLSAESTSRGDIVSGIYSKIIDGRGITPEEKSVLEVESLLGNPMARMQSQMLGDDYPGGLGQFVRERDEETPGQQDTTQTRAESTPTGTEYDEDTTVQLPNGPARFGDLVDTQMEMDDSLSRTEARRKVRQVLERQQQNTE